MPSPLESLFSSLDADGYLLTLVALGRDEWFAAAQTQGPKGKTRFTARGASPEQALGDLLQQIHRPPDSLQAFGL